MYTATISLSNIDSVKKFVEIANQYDLPITLYSEKYIINGKSIMGIFSLDLAKPIRLEIEGDCPEDLVKKVEQFLLTDKQ